MRYFVSMAIRTVIADDEPLARALLARWVRQEPRLRLVGEACDGDEAVHLVESRHAGLVFLDIQMPGPSGVEVLRMLKSRDVHPYVVFVTAHDQHAVDAFDLEAGDYLVKPVKKARFATAVDRASNAMEQRAHMDALQAAHDPLMIREGDRTTVVSPQSITWVEAASQYSRIHTDKAEYLLSRPLADVASELPEPLFLRVHRSALINVGKVVQIHHLGGQCQVELAGGSRVPVARARRREVLEQLREMTRQMQPVEARVNAP
jgi:two-component system LytT family response regulator